MFTSISKQTVLAIICNRDNKQMQLETTHQYNGQQSLQDHCFFNNGMWERISNGTTATENISEQLFSNERAYAAVHTRTLNHYYMQWILQNPLYSRIMPHTPIPERQSLLRHLFGDLADHKWEVALINQTSTLLPWQPQYNDKRPLPSWYNATALQLSYLADDEMNMALEPASGQEMRVIHTNGAAVSYSPGMRRCQLYKSQPQYITLHEYQKWRCLNEFSTHIIQIPLLFFNKR